MVRRIRIARTTRRRDPDVIARLEWLDDLMFAAIDGDPVALEAAVRRLAQNRRRAGQPTRSRNRAANTCAAHRACGTRCGSSPNHPPHKVVRGDRDHLAAGRQAW